jgi:nucleoside-diphosphate kinase
MKTWFEETVIPSQPGDVTFALVKPGMMEVVTTEIVQALLDELGLTLLLHAEVVLTTEDVKSLYWEHVGKEFYQDLHDYMLGKVNLLVIAGPNAVEIWRTIAMPRLRSQYKDPNTPYCQNVVHGSDSVNSAFRELLYFFGSWSKSKGSLYLPYTLVWNTGSYDCVGLDDKGLPFATGSGVSIREAVERLRRDAMKTFMVGAQCKRDYLEHLANIPPPHTYYVEFSSQDLRPIWNLLAELESPFTDNLPKDLSQI